MEQITIDASEYDDLLVDHHALYALCALVTREMSPGADPCPLALPSAIEKCETFSSCESCITNWSQVLGVGEAFPLNKKSAP